MEVQRVYGMPSWGVQGSEGCARVKHSNGSHGPGGVAQQIARCGSRRTVTLRREASMEGLTWGMQQWEGCCHCLQRNEECVSTSIYTGSICLSQATAPFYLLQSSLRGWGVAVITVSCSSCASLHCYTPWPCALLWSRVAVLKRCCPFSSSVRSVLQFIHVVWMPAVT